MSTVVLRPCISINFSRSLMPHDSRQLSLTRGRKVEGSGASLLSLCVPPRMNQINTIPGRGAPGDPHLRDVEGVVGARKACASPREPARATGRSLIVLLPRNQGAERGE
jgi:hypothetical protein